MFKIYLENIGLFLDTALECISQSSGIWVPVFSFILYYGLFFWAINYFQGKIHGFFFIVGWIVFTVLYIPLIMTIKQLISMAVK